MNVFVHIDRLCMLGIFAVAVLLPACAEQQVSEPSPKKKIITRAGLCGVSAPDPRHVWIVGFGGEILHSADGGDTWAKQENPADPVEDAYYDVHFVGVRHGWAVGKFGKIVSTIDGGTTWTSGTRKTDHRLFAVHFSDRRNGWAVGYYGTILHTADGGATWESQGWGEDAVYNDVFFLDNGTGWIVGEYGTMLHTTDGGRKWTKQECADIIPPGIEDIWQPPPSSLYGVYFRDASTGWAIGNEGHIIFTEDGGAHWRKLATGTDVQMFQMAVMGGNGWAVGQRGTYLCSTDSGRTWAVPERQLPAKFWLRDIAFADQQVGWAVGSRGTIIKTEDGGQTWIMISGITPPDI